MEQNNLRSGKFSQSSPVISVLMGVYYRNSDTKLLERSIDSILQQDFRNFELLICDDGSSCEAIELINRFAEKDKRVQTIRTGNAFALPDKLNACISASRGMFIARMDDDDFSHPDRFSKQILFLQAHPETAFVGCNVNLVCEGVAKGICKLPERPAVHDFLFTQPYVHPALIFRREAILAVDGYSRERHCLLCEDYDLLLRLYERGFAGANMQECLIDYSLPPTAKGNRTMLHRWNECVTRYKRFRALRLLPQAFPYVLKPLAVGILPEPLLRILKEHKK